MTPEAESESETQGNTMEGVRRTLSRRHVCRSRAHMAMLMSRLAMALGGPILWVICLRNRSTVGCKVRQQRSPLSQLTLEQVHTTTVKEVEPIDLID